MEKDFVLKKRPLGVEDIDFDIFGDGEEKVYDLDNGSTITVRSLNAGHIPLTSDTRRELNSLNVDDALIKLSQMSGASGNISMTEDTLIAFGSTDDVAEMQRRIDGCERNLGGHTLTITFPASQEQTFNVTLVFRDFYNGKIVVEGTGQNNKITVKDEVNNAGALFDFDNCNCDITVRYFKFVHKNNQYAITCNASNGITLDYCSFEGNGGNSRSVLLKSGGLCYYTNCTFNKDQEPNPQSDIITVKNTYLPLSGGTMTGSLTVNNALSVSGNLTVGGKNAVRSVNNKTADTSGNASIAITDIPDLKSTLDNKLSLSGGTMTGAIIMNGGSIKTASSSGVLYLMGGTNGDTGSYIEIAGKDYKGTDAGGYVYFAARNSTKVSAFKLTPDGNMTLNTKHIVRSVDGINADAAGNVTINALSKSGGTVSGKLTFSVADAIYRNVDNATLTIGGGAAWNTGAWICLFGKNYNNGSDAPGMFKFAAQNGTNTSIFIGTPKGGLSWNGFDITGGYPNYSAGTSTTASSYTANADGWVVVSKQLSGSYLRVKVNGGVVIDGGGSDNDRTSGMFPVKSGDTVTIFSTALTGTTETSTTATIYFYPNR